MMPKISKAFQANLEAEVYDMLQDDAQVNDLTMTEYVETLIRKNNGRKLK